MAVYLKVSQPLQHPLGPQTLQSVQQALQVPWPENRTINFVYHGHSVPAGYRLTPEVRLQGAYPHQVMHLIKAAHPYAVINSIVTAIGGEHSVAGAARFKANVLTHRPDVVFIDYAINDQGLGLPKAKRAWQQMIQAAKVYGAVVVLLTPSPDIRPGKNQPGSSLAQHAQQIKNLAKQHGVYIVDVYSVFESKRLAGNPYTNYLAGPNHLNDAGHALVAQEILNTLFAKINKTY